MSNFSWEPGYTYERPLGMSNFMDRIKLETVKYQLAKRMVEVYRNDFSFSGRSLFSWYNSQLHTSRAIVHLLVKENSDWLKNREQFHRCKARLGEKECTCGQHK